jgi:alginate O-acetyltransferase complex protein AlgJ
MKYGSFLVILTMSASGFAYSAAAIESYPEYFLGKNGWVIPKLDYTDITRLRDVKASWPQLHFDFLSQTVKALESKNIRVVLAIVPQRLNVYPQMLPDDLYSDFTKSSTSYENLLPEISQRGMPAIDLLKSIRSSKYYSSNAATYYRFEAHWNLYGASAAAKSIADYVKTNFKNLKLPQKKYTLVMEKPIKRMDKYWLDALPKNIQAAVPPDFEIPYKITSPNSKSSGLLADTIPSVTIVGTSFTGYGFKQTLGVYLQADILDQSLAGKGMWTPMAKYLNSDSFKKSPPKLIVWEMPEYILLNYPMPTDDEYAVFRNVLNVNKP